MIINNEEVTVLNLTNHDINIYPQDLVDIPRPISKENEAKFLQKCIVIKSHGHARCQIFRDSETVKVSLKSANKKIPLSYTNIGLIDGMPNEKDNTILIVSQLVYNAVHHIRKDVYMVDKPIRTVGGGVIGCQSFSRCVYDDHIKAMSGTIKYLNQRLVAINPDNVLERKQLMDCLVELNLYIKR